MNNKVLLNTELPGLTLLNKGKVRDIYDLGDNLLIVATDRISAFDVILPSGIPEKGKVLTNLSEFWFEFTKDVVSNHLIATDVRLFPEILQEYTSILEGRSMLVRKTKPLPIECVVRGYLAGSGWKEYRKNGSVCGIKLPSGLQEAEKLPRVLFTPSTKAVSGHDINITEEDMIKLVGSKLTEEVKSKSLGVYKKASEYAELKGVIISDTKFEFGLVADELILIDEVLTPDSSRFWDKQDYKPGSSPKNFDKQFVRDYLETTDWDKNPPAPPLPPDVIIKTSERYKEAYLKLTGKELE